MKNQIKKLASDSSRSSKLNRSTFSNILLLSGVLFFACKQDGSLKRGSNESMLSTPSASNNASADIHLKWIAKGYTWVLDNATNKQMITGYVDMEPSHQRAHSEKNPHFVSNNNIDFEDVIFNNIQNNFTTNNYDRNYYFDFQVNQCYYSVGLRHEDPSNASKPLRVTYQSTDTSVSADTAWGYFLGSSGNLDSTLLVDDNYDDYNVFIVFAETSCDDRGAYIDGKPKGGGCNSNGICEPMQGEDATNCVDCQSQKASNQFELEVINATLMSDKPAFEESWIEGKYEIAWNWMITDGSTGIISSLRIAPGQHPQDIPLFNKWKRKELVRCKKNGSKCKGSATSKAIDGESLMYDRFEPASHTILIQFHECDGGRNSNSTEQPKVNGIDVTMPPEFSSIFNMQTKGGTYDEGFTPANNGKGVLAISPGAFWADELVHGVPYKVIEATTPSHNGLEVKVKLGYKL